MKAIMIGAFDPFTLGHRDIAQRALAVFGDLTVAVAEDTGKNTASLSDRQEIAKLATSDLNGVTVESFRGLASDYLAAQGGCILVRGIRNSRDLEYECDHARIYKSLCGVDAVNFITAAEYGHISSSVVRELAGLGGALSGYVTPSTEKIIAEIYGKN